MINTRFIFLIATTWSIMGWSAIQDILTPGNITLAPFSEFVSESASLKPFMSLLGLWSLLGLRSIGVPPYITCQPLTPADVFLREIKNGVKLVCSSFISLKEKSLSALILMLSPANLSFWLAEIVCISMSIIQCANNWTNFRKKGS